MDNIHMKNNQPCKPDCPERSMRCHCICEKYKNYADDREYIRQQRAKSNIIVMYEQSTNRRLYGKKFD